VINMHIPGGAQLAPRRSVCT